MAAQIIKVEPFDLVVFGGTGDLAYRKLFPALFHRDKSEQFTEPTRIIGVSRRHLEARRFARPVRDALAKVRRRDDDAGPHCRTFPQRASTMSPLDVTGDEGWASFEGAARTRRAGARFLPGDQPRSVRPDRQAPRRRGTGDAALAHHRREADRPGWRRARRRSTTRSASVFPEQQHLPHRPLSRQGNGAEPDGAALRQRPVRAGVEQRAYRPRADHRRRDARRRGPRRLLRRIRSAARHGAEPHAATCCAWWRWSRRRRWKPTPCATKS